MFSYVFFSTSRVKLAYSTTTKDSYFDFELRNDENLIQNRAWVKRLFRTIFGRRWYKHTPNFLQQGRRTPYYKNSRNKPK